MAQATVTKRMVPQPPKAEVTGVQLTLTMLEAETLHGLLYRHVVGKGTGPRGVLDRIANALMSADVEPRVMSTYPARDDAVAFSD